MQSRLGGLGVGIVPHVRITELHCYCKHCIPYRLGLGLKLGNIIIAIYGLAITTSYMRKLQTIPAGHCSLCMSAETYFGTI